MTLWLMLCMCDATCHLFWLSVSPLYSINNCSSVILMRTIYHNYEYKIHVLELSNARTEFRNGAPITNTRFSPPPPPPPPGSTPIIAYNFKFLTYRPIYNIGPGQIRYSYYHMALRWWIIPCNCNLHVDASYSNVKTRKFSSSLEFEWS